MPGTSLASLAANLRTLVGGEQVTTIKQGDNQYEVQLLWFRCLPIVGLERKPGLS